MKLGRLVSEHARGATLLAAVAALVAGATSAALLYLVRAGVQSAHSPTVAALYVVLVLCLFGTRVLSAYTLNRKGQAIVESLRREYCARVLSAPLREVETTGAARLLSTLADDTQQVAQLVARAPDIFVSSATIIACAGYLVYVSPTISLVVALALVVAFIPLRLLGKRTPELFVRVRAEQDALFQHYRALTEGHKELALHEGRRSMFWHEMLTPTLATITRDNTEMFVRLDARVAAGELLLFVVIGVVLFVAPSNAAGRGSYAFVLIFVTGPLMMLGALLPLFSRASTSLARLEALVRPGRADLAPVPRGAPPRFARSIELRGVSHTYLREGEDGSFRLGPVDLTLVPGEIVFVAGGNGGGKTTFAKVLLGLYPPEGGTLHVDGALVDASRLDFYRRHFSAVFADFFLLDRLVVDLPGDSDAEAMRILRVLRLDHKVRVENGTLSTQALSTGQRKRLALLSAYLEDRAVLVFDEWAADQDPAFKDVFYRQLLPELKSRGKTIVAITHDDHYYALCDRLFVIDNGALRQVSTEVSAASPLPRRS